MNLSVFEQACLETRRLASLSECLQDLMEDQQANTGSGSGGVLDPDSDLLLNLIAGIYGTGRKIVDLMRRETAQAAAIEPSPDLDEQAALAVEQMLIAVAEVSRTCEQLYRSPFAQEFALPDFAQLAQQSAHVRQKLRITYRGRKSR